MTTALTKQVVVLRTGNLVQFQWASGALEEAGVPFFTREETVSGLRLAMPVMPSVGPGISWAIVVPEPAVTEAREVLSTLPFEIKTEAGIWDFQPSPKVKRGWKIYIWLVLIVGIAMTVANILRH